MELKHYLCCILHPRAARADTSPMACNDSAWMVDRPIVPDLGVLHLGQVIMTKKELLSEQEKQEGSKSPDLFPHQP